MIKCYHFCSRSFLDKLLEENIIYADEDLRLDKEEPVSYVKEYVFKTKKINNGKGMFFAWSNPFYKGNIDFNEKGEYILLELNVSPENICIKTHYENWCSLGVDIWEANGDLELADKYCRESYNIKGGLNESYNSIYEINDFDEIQILLPFIKKQWIISKRKCNKKII